MRRWILAALLALLARPAAADPLLGDVVPRFTPLRNAAPDPAPAPVIEVLEVQDTRSGADRLSKEDLADLTRFAATRIVQGDRFSLLARGSGKSALEEARKRGAMEAPVTANKLLETTVFRFGKQCAFSAMIFDLARGVGEQGVIERTSCDLDGISQAADAAISSLGSVEPKAASFGYVTLDTKPWSEVYVNGVRIGQTPLVKHKLPVGRVEVQMVNPITRREKKVVLEVRPNKTLRYRFELWP